MFSKPKLSQFRFSSKRALVAGLAVALAVLLYISFVSLKIDSYSKTMPYSIFMEVEATQPAVVIMHYDYGFGFNPSHGRSVSLSGDSIGQTAELSVSAWKPIEGLRLKLRPADGEVTKLVISKTGVGEISFGKSDFEKNENGLIVLGSVHQSLRQAQ